MAGDTTIRAIIKILVEGGHIPKEVASEITGVGAASKKTKAELTSLGAAGKELGGILTQYLGAAALGAFIKGGVTEFAALDRNFNALGFTMKKVGIDAATDLPKARAEMEALALSGGPLQTQTVPALQHFVSMTHDTDKALAAVKLASDVSESGVTDFGSAAAGVSALLQGKVKVAATQFGIDLTDINGKAKTNADLIREIQKTYGGLGDAFEDAANKLDSLNARWEQTKQIVGSGFAGSLGAINALLFHTVGLAKDLGEVWGLTANVIVALARGVGRALAESFDLKTLLTDPVAFGTKLNAAIKANVEDMGDAWKVFTDGITANHSTAAAKVADTTKGLAGLIKQATKATAEDEAKTLAEAAQKRLDLEHKTTQEVLQTQIQAATAGSRDRLDLEKALLADQEQEAVEAAHRTGVDVNKIHAAFQLQRAAKDKEFADAREARERELIDRILQLEIDRAADGTEKKYQLEIDAINRRYQAEVLAASKAGQATAQIRLAWEREVANKTLAFIAARMAAELAAAGRVVDSEREMRDADFEYALAGLEADTAASFAIQHAGIEAHFQDVQDDLNRQIDANLQAAMTGAEGTAAVQTELMNKLLANEIRHATATKALSGSVAQYQGQQYAASTDMALNALSQVFGKNRAFALAMLAINTASAVMNAWAHASSWEEGLVETIAIGIMAEAQREQIESASFSGTTGGMNTSGLFAFSGGQSAGSTSGGASGPSAAAEGAIVPPDDGKPLPDGFVAKGTDTKPFMLSPGEIIAPADASAEVIAGRAVIAAPSSEGKPIVDGKLSLIPVKGRAADAPSEVRQREAMRAAERVAPGAKIAHASHGMIVADSGGPGVLPGSRSAILGQPPKPISAAKGVKAPMHAATGMVVPPSKDPPYRSSGGIAGMIGKAGAWFKTAMQPVMDDDSAPKGGGPQTVQLGGAKSSSALMPALGGAAMGATAKTAMQPAPDPGLAKIADKLDALAERKPTSAEPGPVDNSVHIHGNMYGGDEGKRQLTRELDAARRRDSNRVVQ